MTRTVLVAGLSGRLGHALIPYLVAADLELEPIDRTLLEDFSAGRRNPVAHFQASRASVVINLAGMAHVPHGSAVDEVELWRANVELPLVVQKIAHATGSPFVHLSSTKAVRPVRHEQGLYGESKRAAEILLRSAQLRTTVPSAPTRVVRSCAVLAPPYEAGRLALLKKVSLGGRWPGPNIRLPVIHPATLAKIILTSIDSSNPSPFSLIEVGEDEFLRARQVVRQLHATR